MKKKKKKKKKQERSRNLDTVIHPHNLNNIQLGQLMINFSRIKWVNRARKSPPEGDRTWDRVQNAWI